MATYSFVESGELVDLGLTSEKRCGSNSGIEEWDRSSSNECGHYKHREKVRFDHELYKTNKELTA